MNKKNLLPAIVLTVICIVVALALGLTNMITKGVIEEATKAKINESLKSVALDGENCSFTDVTGEFKNLPKTVKAVYHDEIGDSYAVTIERQGYASVVSMTVGVGKDGKIIKAVVTAQQESHGKPDVATLPDKFAGTTADTIDNVELVSGATITSNTIKGGVEDALVALGFKDEAPSLPRTDEELVTMAKELLSGSGELENITKDESGLVKRVFRDKGGKGYVVYTHTYAEYGGGLETETLIAFNEGGTITAVRKLHWVVGHSTEYGPPPPTEEAVDAFFQRFVGKNAEDIATVEVVADATGTSNNVKTAVLEAANALPANDVTARIVGIVAIVFILGGIVAVVIVTKRRRVTK